MFFFRILSNKLLIQLIMKKIPILIMFLMFIGTQLLAQNPYWIMAPKKIYFPPSGNPQETSLPTAPLSDGYGGVASEYTQNLQLDARGEILFFVVDGIVYGKSGDRIGDLYTAVNPGPSYYMRGNAEVVIIPDPASCQRYYIVASADDGYSSLSNRIPHFALLDMSLTNEIGIKGKLLDVNSDGSTIKSLSSITPDYFTGDIYVDQKMGGISIAASKLKSDNSRLLFLTNGKKIYRYKIDNSGLNYLGSFLMSSTNIAFNNLNVRSEMELIDLPGGNYRIAVPFLYESATNDKGIRVFTADLDGSGNLISGSANQLHFAFSASDVYHPFVHGLEFSPNGNILYITHDNSYLHPNPIEYFDFSNPALGVQPLSVVNAIDFKSSQIEIGLNGKLYLATSNRLATLINPNAPNIANWTDNAVTISYSPSYGGGTSSEYYLKAYTLPDQIDGMDYEAHFYATTQCCISNIWNHATAFTATTSATWTDGNNPFNNATSPIYIREELVIPADKNITIKNMVFKFAPDAKVIVDRGGGFASGGGQLTLDNTTFTVDDRCLSTGMWLGVQVYGYSTNAQTASMFFPTTQGRLTLKNNAVIEHAQFGVDLAKLNPSTFWGIPFYLPDENYAGGIVYAENSIFRNNVNDVRFWNYVAPGNVDNLSYFKNCTFITTSQLKDPTKTPQYHAFLQNVVGVKFYGNDFKNTALTTFNYNKRGYGIYSNNSKLYVDARCMSVYLPCSGYDPNVFQGLYYGVYAISNNTTRTIRSDRNKYINNIYGMYLTGQNFATVIRNDFEVFRSKAPNPTIETVGLYLNNSTGYKVEENTFKEYNDPNVSGIGNSIGIVVNNSGEMDNVIYRNTFTNLNVGGQSQNINAPVLPSTGWNSSLHGLKWKCNTFTGNMQTADLLVTSGRIDYQQGYFFSPAVDPVQATKSPAGNKFSHSNNNAENDIKVNSAAQQFQYIHHSDYVTQPVKYTSSKVSPYMNYNIFYPVSLTSNSCPSTLSSEGMVGFQKQQIIAEIDSIDMLIAKKEILLADSEQAVSQKDKNEEANTQKSISQRVILTNELGFLKSTRSYWIYEQIRTILSDTTVENKIEMIQKILNSENILLSAVTLPVAKLPEEQLAKVDILKHFLAPITEGFESPIIEKAESSLIQITEDNDQTEIVKYLSIYPNPTTTVASTTIAVQNISKEDASVYSVEIYDLSLYGKQWWKKDFLINEAPLSVPNNILKSGFYVVKLYQNNNLIETKMLRVD